MPCSRPFRYLSVCLLTCVCVRVCVHDKVNSNGYYKLILQGSHVSGNLREMAFSWKIKDISGKLLSTSGSETFVKCQNVREACDSPRKISGDQIQTSLWEPCITSINNIILSSLCI